MLDFPRWKVILVSIVSIVGVLLAVPTLVPGNWADSLPSWMTPRVELGLDLAGGSHILLEADVADVRKQRLDNMERQVRAAMRGDPGADDDIAFGSFTRTGNSVSFLTRDVAQVDEVRERLNNLTSGAQLSGQRDWDIEVRDNTRFVMTLTDAGLQNFIGEAMAGARDVIERRVNLLGTREPTIILQGSNRIVVQVPGLEDPQALKNLLGDTARLEFREVLEAGQFDAAEAAQGRAPVGYEVVPYADPATAPGPYVVVSRQVLISGDQLTKAQQGYDQNNQPVVNIGFNNAGGTIFARITTQQTGQQFAMLLDNKVLSAPEMKTPILNGQAEISGNFTVETANKLAIQLKSGALPVKLAVVEERTVGPDLGAESIEKGAIAAAVSTLLTLGFIILVYGRFGIYAAAALILNILMIIGVMAVIPGGVLTLPGIAGFVLTIGAAVDANVLINERIREELRRGRKVAAAVETGYKEASRAIFDANITNVIAAGLMFAYGSGPIKGFAVVLTIGIITSVFTAVTVSRMFASHWLRSRPATLNI